VLIANRTEESARGIADEFSGEVVPFEQLQERLADADVVICSTNAPHFVVTEAMMHHARERHRNRPICVIDISVPRNVDPGVGKLPNVFVFDVDDLESVISSNIREREREAERAELIVKSEVMQFHQSLRVMDIGPEIGAFKEKLQDMARAELERHRKRLGALTAEQETAIDALLLSTVNKISHPVLDQMKRTQEIGDAETVQALRDIFGLEE
jgi:glutamyl-tRNA reductase